MRAAGAALAGCLMACGEDGAAPDAPAAPSVDVLFTILDHPANPAAFGLIVAFQDGDGEWTAAERDGATYTLPIRTDRYGVAWTCVSGSGSGGFVGLAYFTLAEMPALAVKTVPGNQCTDDPPSGTFAGTVTGGQGTFISVFKDPQHGVLLSPTDPHTFSITASPTPGDLGVVRFSNDPTASPIQESDKILILRDQAPASDIAVDLATADGPTLTTYDILPTQPDELTIMITSVVTATNTILLGQDSRGPGTGSSTLRVFGLPSAIELAGDRYLVGTTVAANGHQFEEVRAFETLTEISAASFQRMAPFVGTIEGDGSLPAALHFDQHPTADGYTYEAFLSTSLVFWSATFSASWLGDRGEFHAPDLRNVSGWPDELTITGAASVTARAEQSSLGVSDLPIPFAIRAPGPAGTVRASSTL